ncbi:GntR family transcriptional regulator [Rhizobium multihospitium]|uniref:DNA-binding transcriptional regulator, GntR family n=1 Tax=Rhizobium multihospitium TaxID=410764 RepID=A0A1C3VWT3_9HYPH|nr:GntR family transcriptional regulator [Rhizobium multihospitium]SCB32220.1 DNA-binding transcriptional regulator, GntR family [Rhizobium multihospitium]
MANTGSDSIITPMNNMEATQFAAEQIRKAIIAGHFRPGDRLIEQQLTEMLDVSRHPVREALRLLAREGFVELKRNKGATVSAVEAASVTEVYNIRVALGMLALDYLMADEDRLSDSDLRRLEKLANNALRCAELESQAETVQNDLEFQQAIIDATGLQRTIRYFSELTGDVRRFNNLLGVVYTDRKGDAENYVVKLFEAIRDRNLHEAHSIWQAKFTKAAERYLSIIERGKSDGASRAI